MIQEKIRYLHLSDNIYPLVTGGTEIFIQQLINEQIKLKDKYEVLWVCHKSVYSDYTKLKSLEDYKLILEPVLQANRIDRFSFLTNEVPGFSKLLENFKPDVVHIHTLGSRTTLNHLELSKKFGSKILFTLHTPPCSCMGNLLLASHDLCKGDLKDSRCTFFRLRSKKIPFIFAKLISLQDGWLLSPNSNNSFIRLLTSKKLTKSMHASWLKLMKEADLIHVLSDWGKKMLIRQKIDKNKIKLIRTAAPQKFKPKKRLPMEDDVLKLVFWGRCNPQKGIHLVIKALMILPKNLPIKLDIYGPYWGNDNYSENLKKNIQKDDRITICGNLPQKELLKKLQHYDLAVIPSIWMETGPLTLLEAFSVGLPVAGTNLGGIKELLKDQKGCFTIPPDYLAWKKLFLKILNNKKYLEEFKPPKLRTFSNVEKDLSKSLLDILKK